MTDDEKWEAETKLGIVFKPSAPITDTEIFSGRQNQVRRAIDVLNTPSQHAVIYGERGVGKTSLANYLATKLRAGQDKQPLAPHIYCTAADTFSDLWRRVFENVEITASKNPVGFGVNSEEVKQKVADSLGTEPLDTTMVWKLLEWLSSVCRFFLVLDEFDRISDSAVRRSIADTIKYLSDREISTTIVIVGVAESVTDLITQHQSIGRSLVEIQMPRMPEAEIEEFAKKAFKLAGFEYSEKALQAMKILPRGLPHYAHRLGLCLGRAALDRDSLSVEDQDILPAIKSTIENSDQTYRDAMQKAIHSRHKDNNYRQVLLACALAPTDTMGYFTAGQVRDPLNAVMGTPEKAYRIENFIRHLQEFCLEKRGPILITRGDRHDKRYKFSNAHLQPIVLMNAVIAGTLDLDSVLKLISASSTEGLQLS